jgi:hypothetical protein
MRIGIDVGGTNTDIALVDAGRVVAALKTPTRDDVGAGILGAISALSEEAGFDPDAIDAVVIGTTHFIDALVQRRGLGATGAIRLCLPTSAAVPPMVDWPEELVAAVGGTYRLCHGGHEYDSRTISPLRPDELRRAVDAIVERGCRNLAITSVFSPASAEMENEAAAIISDHAPGLSVSLSHRIGRIGLLERENATIINAALRELGTRVVGGLDAALRDAGFRAPLFLSQNDGTLMSADYAREYPVATFSSGPTNSMRGAAYLSGVTDCVVVDVGGTTSDIGVLQGGFPRESNNDVSVSGVRTNFRVPDVLSLGVGGGSVIGTDPVTVGPRSVGHLLPVEALVFGGDTLTATDVAVAGGLADIGDRRRVAHLDGDLVAHVLSVAVERIQDGIDQMRASASNLPVVAVGGGSILIPEKLPGHGEVLRPDYHAMAQRRRRGDGEDRRRGRPGRHRPRRAARRGAGRAQAGGRRPRGHGRSDPHDGRDRRGGRGADRLPARWSDAGPGQGGRRLRRGRSARRREGDAVRYLLYPEDLDDLARGAAVLGTGGAATRTSAGSPRGTPWAASRSRCSRCPSSATACSSRRCRRWEHPRPACAGREPSLARRHARRADRGVRRRLLLALLP